MSTGQSIRAEFEEIKTLGFVAMGPGYVAIGAPLEHPSREMLIQNLTDVTLTFSDDGITDKFKLPRMSYREVDYTANKSQTQGFYGGKHVQWWVKEDSASPTKGEVCISSIYGLND